LWKKFFKLIKTEKDHLERWKERFSKLLNPTKAPFDLPHFQSVTKKPYEIDLQPPSFADVLWALKNVKNIKAQGEDGISAKMYKSSTIPLCQLKDLLVEVWTTKKFPKDRKLSVLIPVYKKGEKAVCFNYQDISLIDQAMEVFCIIILNRFKDAQDMLTRPEQACFRPGKGCQEHILTLRLILQQSFCCRFLLPYQDQVLEDLAGRRCPSRTDRDTQRSL
jgi:hypothetical protein